MSLGVRIPKALTPSPPSSKQLGGAGETHAPTGPSVAGQMVQNSRTRARANVPHAPASRKAPGGAPNKPAPYNALNSPYKTQGQFNQAVTKTTKASYEPELQQFNREEVGERGEHTAREGENNKTYEQYSNQAKEAFERAKNALAEIASRQNSSTQGGQQALQAALSNTGVSGVQGVANPSDFMSEAAGFGNQSSQTLAGTQAGEIAEREGGQLVPGSWREEAQSAENQRDQSELGKIGEGRAKVLAGVPNEEAKVRGELTKEEGERETNRLQSQIAGSKLGLEKTEAGNKNQNEKQTLEQKREEAHENASLKAHELAINSGFEAQKIGLERKKITQAIAEAKTGKEMAAAELRGKRFDNGLQLMSNYLKKNDKAEFQPTGNAQQDTALGEGGKKQPYQRNAQQLYNVLTKQGNLTAPEAFTMMESSNNGYVEQFAHEHRAIYESPTHGKTIPQLEKEHPLTPLHGPSAKQLKKEHPLQPLHKG